MDPRTQTEPPQTGNGHSRSRVDQMRELVGPKLADARDYAEGHKLVTALIGLALGFLVGRLLRRS
jgi:hypothetical protein